jgi:capsid protein
MRPQTPTLQSNMAGLKADYAGAKTSRFRRRRMGIAPMGSGADYHYRNEGDYLRMMEYARDMDRNDMLISQGIDRAVLNTIQDGFRPEPQTGDPAVDLELFNRHKEWAEDPDNCDITGENNFANLCSMALRSSIVDGDVFSVMTETGHLQMIEAHRCRTPKSTMRNVVNGVLVDDLRKPVEYWFTKDELDAMSNVDRVNQITPYRVRDDDGLRQVMHVYNPKRFSQRRGVTVFAPMFDPAGYFEDITFANLVRMQVASCFAILRTRELGFEGPSKPAPTGERKIETDPTGTVNVIDNLRPGMDIGSAPGEKLEGFTPNIPGDGYFQQARLMIQIIGCNIGMPLVLMLMDSSETNFSGWRGAMQQAHMGFQANQRMIVNRLARPVYKARAVQAAGSDPFLARAMDRLGVKFFAHEWNLPSWPYIQPLQDTQANAMRLEKRLISPRRLHNEHNQDYELITDESVLDSEYAVSKAIEAAQRIKKKYKVAVDWHEFLHLPTSNQTSVALQAQADKVGTNQAAAAANKPNQNTDQDTDNNEDQEDSDE